MNALPDRLITAKEASEYLGISVATLAKMRSIGPSCEGLPHIPFVKFSPKSVRYSLRDLEDYVSRHRVCQ